MLSTDFYNREQFLARAVCRESYVAASSSCLFCGGALSESDDNLCEGKSFVGASASDDRQSTQASDEDHDGGEDSTVLIITS